MATQFTSNELNVIRNLVDSRVSRVRLFDDANVQRYDALIQLKTLADRRILITQALIAAELNGFNIVKVQIINLDTSISAEQVLAPSLDKRVGSPTYNLPVNLILTMHF